MLARELIELSTATRREAELLADADQPTPSDEDQAWNLGLALIGTEFEAAVYVGWLRQVTRDLVWARRFVRLVEGLVPVLLEKKVVSGRCVRAMFEGIEHRS